MTITYIRPPFSDYHPANLHRLVQEGFEEIEARSSDVNQGNIPPVDASEFQMLCAADYYLRSKGKSP